MSEIIFSTLCGSHLYGTNTKDSDIDYGDILVESPEQLLGISEADALPQIVSEDKDVNKHWFRKFVKLATKCNPNVLEWLFASESSIKFCHPLFKKYFLDHRSTFLSLNYIKDSHFGFANSQISKMFVYAPDRGAARKELINKYGYDLKYGAHALRLIWQLEEAVRTHDIKFPYVPDICDHLIKIKQGIYAKDQFLDLWKRESNRIEELVEKNPFNLRKSPDWVKVNELLVGFYKEYYGWQG